MNVKICVGRYFLRTKQFSPILPCIIPLQRKTPEHITFFRFHSHYCCALCAVCKAAAWATRTAAMCSDYTFAVQSSSSSFPVFRNGVYPQTNRRNNGHVALNTIMCNNNGIWNLRNLEWLFKAFLLDVSIVLRLFVCGAPIAAASSVRVQTDIPMDDDDDPPSVG